MIDIVDLTPADAAPFQALRLEALQSHPEAFGASYETEAALDLAAVQARLEKSKVFAARDGDSLVGMVGFFAMDLPKMAHRGVLWGLYLRQSHRGQGIARRLIERLLQHAAGQVDQIKLSTVTSNAAALRLYESCGFEIHGRERDALRVGGESYDVVQMFKFFRRLK